MARRAAAWWSMSIGLTLACVLGAAAQPAGQAQQPSSTMPGLSMDGDQPVRIESNTLEVRDKIRQATFAGDVKLTQGDTIIKCRVLVVFYEDTAAPAKKGAPPATAGAQPPPKSGQKLKRAEAKGDVFVIQKEQTASGDNAVFDVKSNTVVMTGNVVVTQGQTVMRGERMVSNLTTGVTKVDSVPIASSTKGGAEPAKSATGRVEMLLQPGAAKDAKATPAPAPPAPAAAPAPPPPSAKAAAPKGPMRLN
jgi:lipopolysaccharide export system protein LptA